jgi:CHAP domain
VLFKALSMVCPRTRWYLMVVTVTVAAFQILLAAPAEAQVVIPGSAWLGGQGVDVCYPYEGECAGNVPTTGGLGFQCVDLPQRLYKKLGWYSGTSFADIRYAYQIYDRAAALGFEAHPNGTGYIPVPGDMIVEDQTALNPAGHVAVVDRVNGGTIYAVEQNANPSGWHEYTLSGSTIGSGHGAIRGIVHAPADHFTNGGSNTWPPPDGTFVRVSGSTTVYRIAGGAAVQLYSCSASGYYPGCSNIQNISQSQLDSLPKRPPDGNFLRKPDGSVFEMVGDSPRHLDSCTNNGYFPGCSDIVDLDGTAVDRLYEEHPVPLDGTFVRTPNGAIYRFAGDSPLYITGCAPFQGACDAALAIPDLAGYGTYPFEGTTLIETDGAYQGAVLKIVGGAPLHLTSCDVGCGQEVGVNQGTIEGLATQLDTGTQHLRRYPANGATLIEGDGPNRGAVFKIVGGAALYLSSCEAGCGTPVPVNSDTLATLAAEGGTVGPQFLLPTPADGSKVKAVPSGHYWEFVGGKILETAATTDAVVVDDYSLTPYPVVIPTQSMPGSGSGEGASGVLGDTTPVTASGTPRSPSASAAAGTLAARHPRARRARLLAHALAVCKRIHSKARRARCIAAARKHYGRHQCHRPAKYKARRRRAHGCRAGRRRISSSPRSPGIRSDCRLKRSSC